MQYTDEEILKKRDEKKKQEPRKLEQGMFMQGEKMDFAKQELFERYLILIPAIWKLMPDELARVKYPSQFRPQMIFTSQDLSVNMGFSTFLQEQPDSTAENMIKGVIETMFQENSNLMFIKSGELEETEGYWFAYRSHAMDSDLFNQLCITVIGKTIVMSSFNCLYQQREEWEEIVPMMWESIVELKKEVHKI